LDAKGKATVGGRHQHRPVRRGRQEKGGGKKSLDYAFLSGAHLRDMYFLEKAWVGIGVNREGRDSRQKKTAVVYRIGKKDSVIQKGFSRSEEVKGPKEDPLVLCPGKKKT